MKRKEDIQQCREILADESVDHLHIRRKAIATGFIDNLHSELEEYQIVSVNISSWDYDEIMETTRYELQKELSLLKYWVSRAKSFGASIASFGGNAGMEARPDYSRISHYLGQVSNKTEDPVVVLIKYHGSDHIGDVSWIGKLDIPDTTTIATDGFGESTVDNTEIVNVGRLSPQQTVDYLSNLEDGIDEREAAEIHRIHDGNPVAIEMAYERGELDEQLSGDALRKLWDEVYDDKISGEELDLLTDSSHLIDLDQRDVALVTDNKVGEAKEILQQLRDKGVVSQKQSGLFTTDRYVKRYTRLQLRGDELSDQHQMSFQQYAEKWIDTYESQMNELRDKDGEGDSQDPLINLDAPDEYGDPNLFLAIHHLSNVHGDIDKETFIEELESIDADQSGVFSFGLIAQRFFFEDPTDVIQDMAEEILGIEEDLENELFSGSLGILFDFDVREYISELSEGWSSGISTSDFGTQNSSQPDELLKRVQQGIEADLYQDLPSDVRLAVTQIMLLVVADSRKASEYYGQFGKTARKYGLNEGPFRNWLDEIEALLDELEADPDDIGDPDEPDLHEERLDELNSEIRDRTDLQSYLEANRSEAQRRFQQRIESIRDRPDEIAEQYIACGEALAETENTLFPYLWYAIGHEMFAKVVLGGEHWDIYGEYQRWSGAREEQEAALGDDEIVVSKNKIEEVI